MARALMDKMKQDYDILNLPEPSWIEDATGEWLDSTDHCRSSAYPKLLLVKTARESSWTMSFSKSALSAYSTFFVAVVYLDRNPNPDLPPRKITRNDKWRGLRGNSY